MTIPARRTVIVPDRLAQRTRRLHAARTRQHGVQAMAIGQVAARLAGGFVRAIDTDSLRLAVQDALPATPLGELDAIKSLAGMVGAATRALERAWLAGIDLQARASTHPRLAALAALELAVLARLPGMLTPAAIAATALERIAHAPRVLGSVDVDGVADLAPCWRPLLLALAERVPLRWLAGARAVPAWVDGGPVEVVRGTPAAPDITVVSAATPAHEALEAMRWMRRLLASGEARADQIALASSDPASFDAHLLALRDDAGIDLHFVHGVPVAASRDGQAACALADILVRGLSQLRLRRLVRLCSPDAPLLDDLPEGWLRALPADAALASSASWERLLARLTAADWPDAFDHTPALATLVNLLQQGPDAAQAAGERLLGGRALAIWRRALAAGPAASLLATLENMKQDDGLDPCASVAWMPAAALAGTPRRFVYLLGLNAGQWPRARLEDALLPDHVVPAAELDPVSQAQQDAADFAAILGGCNGQAVLSCARRNGDGRSLGRSPLLAGMPAPAPVRRNAVPAHAMSEVDRLAARPAEFRDSARALAAHGCWRAWQADAVTPHDGAVRPDHPRLQAIAARVHSATSLQLLLRNPIGYVWEYGLGWKAPELQEESLTLDAAASGNLVHGILDRALRLLADAGGLARANGAAIDAAVAAAGAQVGAEWGERGQLPPAVIWRRTLDEARTLAVAALRFGQDGVDGMYSFGEVAFGGAAPRPDAQLPWEPATPVAIPGTALRIKGYIDRLDVSADGRRAQVRDYKTGKPVAAEVVIGGGAELQRCLYAFAVKAMLGSEVSVRSALLYPRDGIERELAEPDTVMEELTGHLATAHASLLAGNCLPGPDTGGKYDKFLFLLPANAPATYCKRKAAPVKAVLGAAATVWESK
ncbi:PD-(D/E)XK nuclease family protein [Telluria beijingensis]|uniref:PD-(D/E)XK nuclease family protein n=1 Tax=Telluria beijingensis TaxID=3068633 RepID=UPI00279618A4|nr:PD-(D/E)XK nuclease family protein [Massilia sp. REN29]